MGEVMKWGSALAIAAVLAILVGCGGDSATGDPASTASDPLAGYPKGPTREFIVPGGDNAVPLYGREATQSERDQASKVIQKWMVARAARHFTVECRYFSRGYLQTLVAGDAEQVTDGRVTTCPQALAYFGDDASGDFKNRLGGPIDSLRVGAGQGYAQYHGNDGIDYELPVEKERGRWLVAEAAPISEEG
jgi:hypothetical protein